MHVVREELWAANGSHAYMVNFSAGQFKILKISNEIISVEKRSPISVFHVFPVWISKEKDYYLLGTLYRRHKGTPLWHLVKAYACHNPW